MKRLKLSSFMVLACLAACSDDPPDVHPAQVADAPVALDAQLLFVDSEAARAFLLDVSGDKPRGTVRSVELPPSPVLSERRKAHDAALVLCQGRAADTGVEAVPATLVSVAADGHSVSYELGATPFDRLKQSDDGRYVIVYSSGKDSRALLNPNELVVVDLDRDPDSAVTRKTPDGLGHPLTDLLVSPTMHIADEDRRLLVLLSAAEVTLFDLEHLDRRATIVQLDSTRSINPSQVVFSASNPTLYVRADNSDNVFMFRLEKHDNDALGNDFRPAVNPLSGGGGPRDLALYGSGVDERLLVVAERSAEVLVIDPSSSKTKSLKLRQPTQHIVLFEGSSPSDVRVQTRALLYGDSALGISFLDPDDVATTPDDSLESFDITAPMSAMVPLLDEHKAVLLQARGITLLNLNERTLTPISSQSTPSQAGALFDAAHTRLWLGLVSDSRLASVDVETGMTGELRLSTDVVRVLPMFSENRIAVVGRQASAIVVHLVDLDDPDREHLQTLTPVFSL